MTDKQIIIDGCDVSGCEYWKGYCRIASLCDYPGHLCEVTPNCHYKQLQRKEQECERLKEEAIKRSKELIRIRKERQEGQKMNRNLHKQLDQLKADNDELKKLLKDGGLHNLSLMAEKRVLLQTLTEIKEIAEKIANYYDGDEYELMRKDAEQILQKISECEVE